jgi:hypothetical protein
LRQRYGGIQRDIRGSLDQSGGTKVPGRTSALLHRQGLM